MRLLVTMINHVKENLHGLWTEQREYFPIPDMQNSWFKKSLRQPQWLGLEGLNAQERQPCGSLLWQCIQIGFLTEVPDKPLASCCFQMSRSVQQSHAISNAIPTTYLCETGISALVALKTAYRNNLNIEPDLWPSSKPHIKHLMPAMQHQPSH